MGSGGPRCEAGGGAGPGRAREAAGGARFCEFCPWGGCGGRARRAADGEEAAVEEAGRGGDGVKCGRAAPRGAA